jgi:putative transposase
MVISEETDNHTGLSLPQRKSPRLKYFDYSSPGAYFVTICVNERKCLFGSILNDDEMHPNEAGIMVQEWWQKLPAKFGIELDYYVIMPNHFHGIIMVLPVGTTPSGSLQDIPDTVGTTPRGCPSQEQARQSGENSELLFQIIGWFKTMTTNEYIRGVNQKGWQKYDKHLWQPRYHDYVIRSTDKLNMIRSYVQTNPTRWTMDCFHPDSKSKW